MYDISRKKQRWYRRECRRLLRVIDSIQPRYRPEPPFRDETLSLHAHLFFVPKGRARREMMAALLRRTEQIKADIPAALPFCRAVLAVYEDNIALSCIILFYDETYYAAFWDRTDIRYQKWTEIEQPSLAQSLGLATRLTERCYEEEVANDEEHYHQNIRFYE